MGLDPMILVFWMILSFWMIQHDTKWNKPGIKRQILWTHLYEVLWTHLYEVPRGVKFTERERRVVTWDWERGNGMPRTEIYEKAKKEKGKTKGSVTLNKQNLYGSEWQAECLRGAHAPPPPPLFPWVTARSSMASHMRFSRLQPLTHFERTRSSIDSR